jgi:phosphoglycolate phosphatase
MYQLIVFDWDGTLMDSAGQIIACMEAAFEDLSLDSPGPDAIRNIIGLGLTEAVSSLVPDADDELVQQLYQAYRRHFLHPDTPSSDLFPGVEETLETLRKADYLLAVATGKGRAGLDKVLADTGLGEYFVVSRCADETFSKPHPEMLNQILDVCGVEGNQALMIGDTEYDLQMATNAGMKSVAVSYGAHEVARLQKHQPLACLDSLTELPAYLNIWRDVND